MLKKFDSCLIKSTLNFLISSWSLSEDVHVFIVHISLKVLGFCNEEKGTSRGWTVYRCFDERLSPDIFSIH